MPNFLQGTDSCSLPKVDPCCSYCDNFCALTGCFVFNLRLLMCPPHNLYPSPLTYIKHLAYSQGSVNAYWIKNFLAAGGGGAGVLAFQPGKQQQAHHIDTYFRSSMSRCHCPWFAEPASRGYHIHPKHPEGPAQNLPLDKFPQVLIPGRDTAEALGEGMARADRPFSLHGRTEGKEKAPPSGAQL